MNSTSIDQQSRPTTRRVPMPQPPPAAGPARPPAEPRKRRVTTALRAYAAFATSAARGAVRIVPE